MSEREEHESLGTALPAVMAHIRDVVIPAYASIGPAGMFAILHMRRDLDLAAKAMAEGDLMGMLCAYRDLKDYKL